MSTKCFFAYPSQPSELAASIRSSLKMLKDEYRLGGYIGWEENDIAGRFIREPILSQIDHCDFLAADVTRLNFNVTYEIGYAIGRKRRILLTRNSSLNADDSLIRETGIFDTLGHKPYNDDRSLAGVLRTVSDFQAFDNQGDAISTKQPVYVVLPKTKNEYDIHLLSQVKKARLRFRSFDPDEQPRLSASEAIRNVVASYGIIVPLLSSNRRDFQVHNLRAAFVAGLSHGLEKELLLLQFGDDPVPLDYRDLVSHVRSKENIDGYIAAFAPTITGLLQPDVPRVVTEAKSFLAKMNLGAPAAENEMGELSDYYLETEEFRKTARGEAQIVAGRKGSGKSALFFRLRDRYRPSKTNVVLDLRPEGFQLRKFKDVVLECLEHGTREHTITAFWEYLLLLEICHRILASDRDTHMLNNQLFTPYQELAKEYRRDEFVAEMDFAERMMKLLDRITADFQGVIGIKPDQTRLTTGELTSILYKHDTKILREKISHYLQFKNEIWILFDNLDKGWPPRGLSENDVLILRCLVEAMSKLEKYLRRGKAQCHCVLFLRNDVYELLVENTTDRGKTSRVTLDWTDPEMLREMLRRRLVNNSLDSRASFESIWQQICVSHVGAEESASYLLERCLMRPRSLIELVYACRTHAVNLDKTRIDLHDIEEGEKTYSGDLIEYIGLEMRDVYPNVKPDVKDILYEFVGSSVRLNAEEINLALKRYGASEALWNEILDLLLWWGFFGVVRPDGEVAYIYSVQYHMSHLKALIRKASPGPVYYINPAFWAGLEVAR